MKASEVEQGNYVKFPNGEVMKVVYVGIEVVKLDNFLFSKRDLNSLTPATDIEILAARLTK